MLFSADGLPILIIHSLELPLERAHEWPLMGRSLVAYCVIKRVPQVEIRLCVTSGPERRHALDDPEHRHRTYGIWGQV